MDGSIFILYEFILKGVEADISIRSGRELRESVYGCHPTCAVHCNEDSGRGRVGACWDDSLEGGNDDIVVGAEFSVRGFDEESWVGQIQL